MPEDELDNTNRQDLSDRKPDSVTSTGVHSLVGVVIEGKYRVIERLGSGGMGAVYKAEHSLMERVVALKVLHPHLVENDDLLKRFQHEARVASKLDHPHAIATYDFGVYLGAPYLVMEFVQGRTLKDRMTDIEPISFSELREIFLQVASALAQAHELGIVHRDLKPDNIMLTKTRDGSTHARVLDFGIAKVLNETSGKNQAVLTQAGTFFGTPKYASPEQVLEKRLDGRSDLYTLGIILYEVLSGATPFEAPSVVEILMKQLHEAPLPLRKFRPEANISPELEALVMKCLEKDPAKRWQSMDEFSSALRGVRKVKSSRLLFRAGAGVTGAAALALLAYFLVPSAERKIAAPAPTAKLEVKEAPAEPAKPDPAPPVAAKGPGNPLFALALKQAISAMRPDRDTIDETVETPPVSEELPVVEEPPTETPPVESPPVVMQPPQIEEPPVIAREPVTNSEPPVTEEIRKDIAKTAEGKKEAIKLYNAGRALLQQKRYADAASKFEQAIQYRSDAIGSYISLGLCYQRLGEQGKALAAFQSAVKIDPSYGPAHFNLAAQYVALENWAAAVASLKQAIRIDSGVRSLVNTDPDFAALRARPEYAAISGR